MVPLVSILVPVFNRESLLAACLDSALAQSFRDFEIVVVDGASTDGTWDVCRRYAAKDERVRVFREDKNTGPVRGWWSCVERARGKYATFLWSDDLFRPDFLKKAVAVFSDEVAFVFTAAEVGTEPGRGTVMYAMPGRRTIPSSSFVHGSLVSRGRFPVSPACALFRLDDLLRNFVMELPEPSLDLTTTGAGVDLLFFLLSASSRRLVGHVPEPLAFFRAHSGSITTSDGSGRVALSYALAKCWYAREHGKARLIPTILCLHWLAHMYRSRSIISPQRAVEDYQGLVSPGTLLLASIRSALSLAASFGRHQIASLRVNRGGQAY